MPINTFTPAHTQQFKLLQQLSEVEMKFLLVHFIAVFLIIPSSSLLPTAQSGAPALIANYTLLGPEGMKGDRKPAPFTSCKELYQSNPALPSGKYNIKPRQKKKRVYCEMNTINCGDITGGWMRVGYIDANSERYNCTKWKLNYTGAWAALSTSDFVFSSTYSNVHSSTFGQTWLLLSQLSNTQGSLH